MESLLFDAFIPAAYRRDPSGRWTAQKAENWLVFLARHLEQKIGGPDLAWWQLPLATRAYPLADGILTGVSTAIFGGVVVGGALVVVGVTAVVAFVIGAVFGAVAGS